MFILTKDLVFPHPSQAGPSGLLAIGGDLSPERLELAYRNGIFPWYSEGEPICWYCPPQRFVLFPDEIKIHKSMAQILRREDYTITVNKAFSQVISACKTSHRPGQDGTWITPAMEAAYNELHRRGLAISVEVWMEGALAGGLYGVDMHPVFCGESMFSRRANASKIAFIYLARQMGYAVIDCQIETPHLASLGAKLISREAFLNMLPA